MAEEDTKDTGAGEKTQGTPVPEQATENNPAADAEKGRPADEEKAKDAVHASKDDPKPETAKEEAAKPAGKPAAKAEKEEPPAPVKTSNEDTQAFLAASEYYSPEQVEDIKPNIPAVRVPKEKLVDAMRYLRDVLHYEHLACITAIDWQKGDLEVVYNLWSYSKNRPMAVRVACKVDDPVVPSVTSVWKGADWLEREEYDLMGIRFEGHPDLRRIMLPEGWRGHPLRKDYEWKKEQFVGMDDEGNDVVYQEAREDAW